MLGKKRFREELEHPLRHCSFQMTGIYPTLALTPAAIRIKLRLSVAAYELPNPQPVLKYPPIPLTVHAYPPPITEKHWPLEH